MPKTPTVPTDVQDTRVMRAWYQSLKESLDGVTLSVKDYGAEGNGSVDDTDAFKRAIADIGNNHNTLYIPAGNYKITAELAITVDVIIRGDGPETSVIEPHLPATGGNLFSFTAGDNVLIKDLGFDGTDAAQTTPTNMVYMINVDPTSGTIENINIENLRFKSLDLFKGTYGVDADGDLRVSHCIFLDNVDNATVTECHIDDTTGCFVYAQYVNHLIVSNNFLKNVGWYPIHLEARVKYFHIMNNYFNQAATDGSLFGGFIDVLEDTTVAIPNSGTDADREFYNNGVIANNYMEGRSAYASVINVLSVSGVTISGNILNGIAQGTLNGTDGFMYNIHVGTRAASSISNYGPPINVIVEGNMIRSTDNGGDDDYGIRIDNDFQSNSVANERRRMENIIVRNNIMGFNLYNSDGAYSDVNLDKGIYFDGMIGGMQNIVCEDNSIICTATAQSAADGAGAIDFIGSTTTTLDGIRVGGNRVEITGSPSGSTIVGINFGSYVENVVNTKPNYFKGAYTAVETSATSNTNFNNLDDQIVEGATDAYIFGTALTATHHTTLSGTTANRPASGKNRTDYMTYFDTDLGYAIWFDGTNWVDSAGTTV